MNDSLGGAPYERERGNRKERQTGDKRLDAARDAPSSSSRAADLGLMSCNKTWPCTPEIGPLGVMLGSSRH